MAKPRTFIIPGDPPHLARIKSFLNEDVCGILVHSRIPVARALAESGCDRAFAQRMYTLQSLAELTHPPFDEQSRRVYEQCLHAILSDPRAQYLATRTRLNTAFNNTILIEKAIVNSLAIFWETRPERLLSTSTPHSLEAWVLASCCEALGIPVFILERTPINNRAWVYRGLDEQVVVPRAQQYSNAQLTPYTQKQVREQQESPAGARDEKGFLLSRMDMNSIQGVKENRWWSYRRELQTLFSGRWRIPTPVRTASVWLKYRLYKSYEKHAVRDVPKEPFVVFFMHYQPERSSLPEGLFHVQQWTAIRLLAWTLPEGWKLLVREHPATWLHPLHVSVRTADLYDEIAALPNTSICSMDVDTFELIDSSRVVVTLTGSVGFQALLRSRPVIAFGLPAYKDHPACFNVRTGEELGEAFRRIQHDDLSPHFSRETLEKYLLWVEANSIVADPNETNWLEARLKNFTVLYQELLA